MAGFISASETLKCFVLGFSLGFRMLVDKSELIFTSLNMDK